MSLEGITPGTNIRINGVDVRDGYRHNCPAFFINDDKDSNEKCPYCNLCRMYGDKGGAGVVIDSCYYASRTVSLICR